MTREWYFLHECESPHRRLAICGERERQTLADMYANVKQVAGQ